MATTTNGIYYPNDYSAIADVPEDMKKIAESIEPMIVNINNSITNIQDKNTEQDSCIDNLETNVTNIQTKDIEQDKLIEELQLENKRLKEDLNGLPTITVRGETLDLRDTAEMRVSKFKISGNSKQDGEPTPDTPIEVESCGDNVNLIIDNGLETTDTNYKKQVYTIATQQPMRSVGEVEDTFIKKDNKKYERHNMNRYVFTGQEDFILSSSSADTGIYQYRTNANFLQDLKIDPDPFNLTNVGLCNYFKKIGYANGLDKVGFTLNGEKRVCFNTKFASVSDLQVWLTEKYNAGTPLYIDYLLAEPLDLECTQEQVEILTKIENELKTYKGTTHIYSTDNVSPIVEVTYKKDLDNLQTQIDEIKTLLSTTVTSAMLVDNLENDLMEEV